MATILDYVGGLLPPDTPGAAIRHDGWEPHDQVVDRLALPCSTTPASPPLGNVGTEHAERRDL